VEVGFPSAVEETLLDYMDGHTDHPTESVYGYVPVEVVAAVIERHGGVASGELPPFLGTFTSADLHSLSVTERVTFVEDDGKTYFDTAVVDDPTTDESVSDRFAMLELDIQPVCQRFSMLEFD
jgi:hypothetical protein